MDEINKLLEKTGLSSIRDTGLTIISLYGVSDNKRTSTLSNSMVKIANKIVGSDVFTSSFEQLHNDTIEIADKLQLHVDLKARNVYLFMDANIETTSFIKSKSFVTSMMDHQSNSMKALFLMLTVSHLVIPILPNTLLPTEFLSTLVALGQVKANMYTHLVQYQTACWKYWNIDVPSALFEKKEFERVSSALLGWWGPAKGVPLLVFIVNNVPLPAITPVAIKKIQEILQKKIRMTLQALQLVPVKPEGNSAHLPIEVRSLFLLPSTSQPIIHVIPAASKTMHKTHTKEYVVGQSVSLSSYLQKVNTEDPPETCLYHECGNKLLKNFVTIWVKAAINRHPMHSNYNSGRKGDISKPAPLPSAMQFISAVVPLLAFLFNKPITENGADFKKIITSEYPSTKGMIQQIDVILRKKIRDSIEVERVFSKSHSMDVLQKCVDTYLQDSPPYYTQQYHKWKQQNVLRIYRSLARGPCMEECALRLERECESIWKHERQSCEQISLTGKPCRLKLNHDHESMSQKQLRDERSVFVDPAKHNSGATFFHACNCGKSQRVREDPFDIQDANVKFYSKFVCCLGVGRFALDIKRSTFGDEQHLVLHDGEIPVDDCAILFLGPSSIYKNNIGLDKIDGFMASTNFLIPWSITTIDEVKLRRQQQQQIFAVDTEKFAATPSKPKNAETTIQSNQDAVEWPALGQAPVIAKPVAPPAAPIVSLEAFPALGTNPTPASTNSNSSLTATTSNSNYQKQLFDTFKRRRYHRSRERIQGLIRGYIGAEYECPNGHRFFSCGEGRVCKLGHSGHPKEHGNYFVHQDLPIYIVCPCSYSNGTSSGNTNSASNSQLEVTAQLLRLYVVTPEDSITISIEPRVQIAVPGSDDTVCLNLNVSSSIFLGPQSMYVLRLPFIYRDSNGVPIPVEPDVQKRLKCAILQKDCIKFHFRESKKWEIQA